MPHYRANCFVCNAPCISSRDLHAIRIENMCCDLCLQKFKPLVPFLAHMFSLVDPDEDFDKISKSVIAMMKEGGVLP